MQRLRVRIASLVVLSLVVGCDDGHPPLPPPPAEATASCVYKLTADNHVSTSTLWFNSLDQVIRIDGYAYTDAESYRDPTYVDYDADGRVIAQEDSRGPSTWTYSPDQIERTGFHPAMMRLVDGRVTHAEFPTYRAPEDRYIRDYAYDAAGRLVLYSGDDAYDAGDGTITHNTWRTEYLYDQEGRVISATRDTQQRPSTLNYTELENRLTVDIVGGGGNRQQWLFEFDADHRLVHHEVTSGGETTIVDYVYSEGVIEQHFGPRGEYSVVATGRCDPPVPSFAPDLPLPVRWEAAYTRFRDLPTTYLNAPY